MQLTFPSDLLKIIMSPKKESELDRIEQYAKIFSLFALPLIVAIGGWMIQTQANSSKLKLAYLSTAITILQADPNEQDPTLRSWAANTFAENSSIPLSENEVEKLTSGKVVLPASVNTYNYDSLGRIVSVSDSSGNLTHFEYNSNGVDSENNQLRGPGSADQPVTAPESKPEGNSKSKPELERHSQ